MCLACDTWPLFSWIRFETCGRQICLNEIVSNMLPVPVTVTGLPSYFTTAVVSMGVPSFLAPLVVIRTRPSTASRLMVWLTMKFTGGLPCSYFTRSTLRFHVPKDDDQDSAICWSRAPAGYFGFHTCQNHLVVAGLAGVWGRAWESARL